MNRELAKFPLGLQSDNLERMSRERTVSPYGVLRSRAFALMWLLSLVPGLVVEDPARLQDDC